MDYPVFVINGFLDSGKSTFIIDTLTNDGFYKQGDTLLLVCEEGEVEYDVEELKKYRVHTEFFSDQSEFTIEKLFNLTETYHPDRIVIENNSMWDINDIKYPSTFRIGQIVSFIDFSTFPIYYNNMRQKFVDNLRFSDLIVINRCDDVDALNKYQTSLKMINNNAQWIAMNSEKKAQEAFEAPLPYDIDAPIIEVNDEDFGRFYIDTFDHRERYEGKMVNFKGIVIQSRKLPKNTFIVGRYAMTCCAKDIQLYGHLCKNLPNTKLKNKSWIDLTAKITYEYSEEYDEDEVVLEPTKIDVIPEIKDAVLDLT